MIKTSEPVLRSPVTVATPFVRGMLSAAVDAGYPVDRWLLGAGVDPANVKVTDSAVTADQYIDIYRLAMQGMHDEGLGFFRRPMRPGCYAMVMHSMMDASTTEHAMHRLAHGFSLLLDDAQFECGRHGDEVALRLHLPAQPRRERDYVHEFMVRICLHSLVWLQGGRLRARRIDFGMVEPPHAAEYRTVFPGAVAFGQPCSAIFFSAEELSRPLGRDAGALRDFLLQAPGHVVLPRRTDRTMASRVRRHLQRERPHWPDLPAVADAMHMSVSSLQRRLAADGTSFQALRNELRRDLALVRLTGSMVPLAELAHELGFEDTAAFQRAFKGWTGIAPGTYRDRHRERLAVGAEVAPAGG
jgi:AraC-like DNA-binding protein